MESPPSSSAWSETAFILSDDSGLLLTASSASSSASGDGRHRPLLEDSDCDDKSLSQDSSSLGSYDLFNTLKKAPPTCTSPIEPPPEFQDRRPELEHFSSHLAAQIMRGALRQCERPPLRPLLRPPLLAPEFVPFSPPCHRPASRCSLGGASSRLSSSHNSLSVPAAHRVDDSSFITQAVSHDTLSSNQISDLYTVPFDSDVYAVPVDVVRPPARPNKRTNNHRRRRRNTASGCREIEQARQGRCWSKRSTPATRSERYPVQYNNWYVRKEVKRHSLAGPSGPSEAGEPIHMTLQEVRHYLQTLYSSSSDSSDPHHHPTYNNNNNNNISNCPRDHWVRPRPQVAITPALEITNSSPPREAAVNATASRFAGKKTFLINIKNKKVKDSCGDAKPIAISPLKQQIGGENNNKQQQQQQQQQQRKIKTPAKLFTLKRTLCNIFRFRRFLSPDKIDADRVYGNGGAGAALDEGAGHLNSFNHHYNNNISSRALPPLPHKALIEGEDSGDYVGDGEGGGEEEQALDFATNIQKVKDYGWYWGPLSSEVAEKILSNEPDGSFIVRDSSDDHYIFSLTFKLNNCVRHVRIDHDQGNFSFASRSKFKSQTIVEFIENAVEHSRSGRYLFFLHRRPVIGPVRVQLLHPVSRFKQVQSLQHICRFVIHKVVRRDLIPGLPLPRRMIDYLNTPHYYSEHLVDLDDENNPQVPARVPTPAIRRDYNLPQNQDPGAVNTAPIIANNYYVVNNNNNNNNATPRQS